MFTLSRDSSDEKMWVPELPLALNAIADRVEQYEKTFAGLPYFDLGLIAAITVGALLYWTSSPLVIPGLLLLYVCWCISVLSIAAAILMFIWWNARTFKLHLPFGHNPQPHG